MRPLSIPLVSSVPGFAFSSLTPFFGKFEVSFWSLSDFCLGDFKDLQATPSTQRCRRRHRLLRISHHQPPSTPSSSQTLSTLAN
ncbi:hypothetical protein Pyn_12611 [Prunus yedoensis var. nudiflora]|uniref:Uncharacterized protein n=1 Tax=Prunus yedoensis var. nudiflora TaxID=2094558 RepID=A0A314V116_PRUYE|nr:hypothetical protein Pyn_12611 [Prunus yedoensis var. nudiflora]